MIMVPAKRKSELAKISINSYLSIKRSKIERPRLYPDKVQVTSLNCPQKTRTEKQNLTFLPRAYSFGKLIAKEVVF